MRELLADPDEPLSAEPDPAEPGATRTGGSWRYEPALDGLRALAVIAVLLYHNQNAGAPGGFLGVDVFFVLSGFLITSLLIGEWHRGGGINVLAFWGRRARRLLPALGLLLVGIALYAVFVAQPTQRHSIRLDGIATLFYVENWRLVFSHQTYFDLFSAPSPLRHAWSLAIEEQWYLVWPLLLGLMLHLARGRVSRVVPVVIGLTVVSAGLMYALYEPGHDPSRVYYGTDTRAQALLIGSLLAFVLLGGRRAASKALRVAVEVLGIAGAAYLVWLVTHVHDTASSLYTGGLTLAALAAALVIAAAVHPSSRVLKPMLSVPPLRWIGLISYGIYLFHWPIFLWLTPTRTGLYGWRLLTIRVDATIAIAIASYFLVEMPVRRRAWRRPWIAFAVPGVAVATALVVATVYTAPTAPVFAAPPPGAPMARAAGLGRNLRVLVAGDSVGWTLAWIDTTPVARMGVDIETTAIIGCGIGGGSDDNGGTTLQAGGCKTWPDVYRQNMKTANPDLVLLVAGSWELISHKVDGVEMGPGDPAYHDYLFRQLDEARQILTSKGARLVIALTPCFDRPVQSDSDPSRQQDDPARISWLNGVWTQFAAAHPSDVSTIQYGGLLCPGGTAHDTINGVQVRKDGMHFTNDGAIMTWSWIIPKLAAIEAARHHG